MRAASSASTIRRLTSSWCERLLERREEDTGDAALDVPDGTSARPDPPCELPAPIRAAPQQRVLARERRPHHPLADRLEDFGLAEVGNEQAEREPGRGA